MGTKFKQPSLEIVLSILQISREHWEPKYIFQLKPSERSVHVLHPLLQPVPPTLPGQVYRAPHR